LRPLFISDGQVGGVVPLHPRLTRVWSGDNIGDLLVGVKINFLSEERQDAMALAVRPAVKLPTGDDEAGASTGKADAFLDVVGSKVIGGTFELAAYGGAALRGEASQVSSSNGFRWGVGGAFPSNGVLRVTLELNGERSFDDTVTLSAPLVGVDGSLAPLSSELASFAAATLGLTWRARNGFFLGGGLTWSMPGSATLRRSPAPSAAAATAPSGESSADR
jgi:hypothetical protein